MVAVGSGQERKESFVGGCAGIDGIKVVAVTVNGDQPITTVGVPGGESGAGNGVPEGSLNGDGHGAQNDLEGMESQDGSCPESSDGGATDDGSIGKVASVTSNASGRASVSLARMSRRVSDAVGEVRGRL